MVSPQLNKQVITATPATGPRYGLLFVASQILTDLAIFHAPSGPGMAEGQNGADPRDEDIRWTLGVKWSPEQTLGDGGGALAISCLGDTAAFPAAPDNPGVTTADPFVIWAAEKCSTIGWKGRDFEGRARRQLEATQSYRIAAELWSGTLAQAATLDNEWLTDDPAIITAAPIAPHLALGIIESGLAVMLRGRRGMIHVSPQVLAELVTNGTVRLAGQLWLSPLGHLIVADAGYPGTGPDGNGSTKQWMYGTSLVGYRLDEIIVIPGSFNDAHTIGQATDLDTNSVVLRAERAALLQWDWHAPIAGTAKFGVVAAETDIPAFDITP